MSLLFNPLRIKDVTIKNRIAISPMCMYSATDGLANEWHMVHLGSRASGGSGLIIQEATAVSAEGRISPGDLGLYHDDQVEMMRKINSFITSQGSVPAVQLAHAGRKAGCALPWNGGKQLPKEEGGWETISSSPLPFYPTDHVPRSLDIQGIQKVIDQFKSAAFRSFEAGFKVIEIHAAHGYLIHQFLSPLSNARSDHYGGSFENRTRFLREIVQAIHEVWPENLPLFVRISATDWMEGGWTLEDSVKLSSELKALGVDLIDCSSGGASPHAKIPFGPGYQVPLAAQIKKQAGILTGAVGLINDAIQAEEIIQQNHADLVLFGRASLRDPNLALNYANSLNEAVDWPIQYIRGKLS